MRELHPNRAPDTDGASKPFFPEIFTETGPLVEPAMEPSELPPAMSELPCPYIPLGTPNVEIAAQILRENEHVVYGHVGKCGQACCWRGFSIESSPEHPGTVELFFDGYRECENGYGNSDLPPHLAAYLDEHAPTNPRHPGQFRSI
jgi:hypothetical protein